MNKVIHLGTSGWYYDDWVDTFYPKDLEKSKWLSFYAQQFDTVEVNASFYRLPFENMVKGWRRKAPDDFLFTFKGSRVITHRKKLKDSEEYLDRFYSRIREIGDKLGIILWQLPPNLHRDDEKLEAFLNMLDSSIRQVIEFRHESWFDQKVYNLLEKYNVGYCILSAPGLPTVFESTSDFAYVRWHGKNDWYKQEYSKQELGGWASQINQLDVSEVFGYFNNDYQGFAPKNCAELKQMLGD